MGNNSSTTTSSPKGLTSELHKTPPTSTSAIAPLLSRGVDPYAPYAPTPLIAAVTSGCMPTIQLLTAHGALTNCPGHGPPSTTAPPLWLPPGKATTMRLPRKPPRQSCGICREQLLWLHILALLRRYRGRPIVAESVMSGGDALIDAYVDLISHTEEWEERGVMGAFGVVDAFPFVGSPALFHRRCRVVVECYQSVGDVFGALVIWLSAWVDHLELQTP